MNNNPFVWLRSIAPYISKPSSFMGYGFLCLIDNGAPRDVKDNYVEYINLVKKSILTWDETILEDGIVIGFEDTDSPIQREQISIAKELIRSGVIPATIM